VKAWAVIFPSLDERAKPPGQRGYKAQPWPRAQGQGRVLVMEMAQAQQPRRDAGGRTGGYTSPGGDVRETGRDLGSSLGRLMIHFMACKHFPLKFTQEDNVPLK